MGSFTLCVESTSRDIQSLLQLHKVHPKVCVDVRRRLDHLVKTSYQEAEMREPGYGESPYEICNAIAKHIVQRTLDDGLVRSEMKAAEHRAAENAQIIYDLRRKLEAAEAALENSNVVRKELRAAHETMLLTYFREVFVLRHQIEEVRLRALHKQANGAASPKLSLMPRSHRMPSSPSRRGPPSRPSPVEGEACDASYSALESSHANTVSAGELPASGGGTQQVRGRPNPDAIFDYEAYVAMLKRSQDDYEMKYKQLLDEREEMMRRHRETYVKSTIEARMADEGNAFMIEDLTKQLEAARAMSVVTEYRLRLCTEPVKEDLQLALNEIRLEVFRLQDEHKKYIEQVVEAVQEAQNRSDALQDLLFTFIQAVSKLVEVVLEDASAKTMEGLQLDPFSAIQALLPMFFSVVRDDEKRVKPLVRLQELSKGRLAVEASSFSSTIHRPSSAETGAPASTKDGLIPVVSISTEEDLYAAVATTFWQANPIAKHAHVVLDEFISLAKQLRGRKEILLKQKESSPIGAGPHSRRNSRTSIPSRAYLSSASSARGVSPPAPGKEGQPYPSLAAVASPGNFSSSTGSRPSSSQKQRPAAKGSNDFVDPSPGKPYVDPPSISRSASAASTGKSHHRLSVGSQGRPPSSDRVLHATSSTSHQQTQQQLTPLPPPPRPVSSSRASTAYPAPLPQLAGSSSSPSPLPPHHTSTASEALVPPAVAQQLQDAEVLIQELQMRYMEQHEELLHYRRKEAQKAIRKRRAEKQEKHSLPQDASLDQAVLVDELPFDDAVVPSSSGGDDEKVSEAEVDRYLALNFDKDIIASYLSVVSPQLRTVRDSFNRTGTGRGSCGSGARASQPFSTDSAGSLTPSKSPRSTLPSAVLKTLLQQHARQKREHSSQTSAEARYPFSELVGAAAMGEGPSVRREDFTSSGLPLLPVGPANAALPEGWRCPQCDAYFTMEEALRSLDHHPPPVNATVLEIEDTWMVNPVVDDTQLDQQYRLSLDGEDVYAEDEASVMKHLHDCPVLFSSARKMLLELRRLRFKRVVLACKWRAMRPHAGPIVLLSPSTPLRATSLGCGNEVPGPTQAAQMICERYERDLHVLSDRIAFLLMRLKRHLLRHSKFVQVLLDVPVKALDILDNRQPLRPTAHLSSGLHGTSYLVEPLSPAEETQVRESLDSDSEEEQPDLSSTQRRQNSRKAPCWVLDIEGERVDMRGYWTEPLREAHTARAHEERSIEDRKRAMKKRGVFRTPFATIASFCEGVHLGLPATEAHRGPVYLQYDEENDRFFMVNEYGRGVLQRPASTSEAEADGSVPRVRKVDHPSESPSESPFSMTQVLIPAPLSMLPAPFASRGQAGMQGGFIVHSAPPPVEEEGGAKRSPQRSRSSASSRLAPIYLVPLTVPVTANEYAHDGSGKTKEASVYRLFHPQTPQRNANEKQSPISRSLLLPPLEHTTYGMLLRQNPDYRVVSAYTGVGEGSAVWRAIHHPPAIVRPAGEDQDMMRIQSFTRVPMEHATQSPEEEADAKLSTRRRIMTALARAKEKQAMQRAAEQAELDALREAQHKEWIHRADVPEPIEREKYFRLRLAQMPFTGGAAGSSDVSGSNSLPFALPPPHEAVMRQRQLLANDKLLKDEGVKPKVGGKVDL